MAANNLLGPACCDEGDVICYWGPQDVDLNTPEHAPFFGVGGSRIWAMTPEQEIALFNNGTFIPWGIINGYWNSRNYGPHLLDGLVTDLGSVIYPVNFQAWTGPPETPSDDPGYSFVCLRHKCNIDVDPGGGTLAGGMATVGTSTTGAGLVTPYDSPNVLASLDPDFRYTYGYSGSWTLPQLDPNAPRPPGQSTGSFARTAIATNGMPSFFLEVRQTQSGSFRQSKKNR